MNDSDTMARFNDAPSLTAGARPPSPANSTPASTRARGAAARISALGPSRRCLVGAALALTAAGGLPGQRSKLSALSSWSPGHRLHLGISVPGNQFDACYLLVSATKPPASVRVNGVQIVIDWRTAVPIPVTAQYGAKPGQNLSAETKWFANFQLPAGMPPTTLRFQAALLASGTGQLDVSEGIVRQTRPPAPGEMRFAAELGGDRLRIAAIDVDRFVASGFGTVTSHTVTEPSGRWSSAQEDWSQSWNAPPERSPDDRYAVLSWNRVRRNRYAEVGFVYVFDTTAGTGFFLPFHGTAWRPGQARFLPGRSDRVFVLEHTGSRRLGGARLACYDLANGGVLLRTTSVGASPSIEVENGWSFDSRGGHAHFLSYRVTSGFSDVHLESFPVSNGVVQANGVRRFLDTNSTLSEQYVPRRMLAIPDGANGDAVLAHWYENTGTTSTGQFIGRRKLCGGTAGLLTAPRVGPTGGPLYPEVAAPDGSYCLFGDGVAVRSQVLDLRPAFAAGQPIPGLAPLALPWTRPLRRGLLGIHGDVCVAISASQSMQRIAWDPSGTGVVAENVHGQWSSRHTVVWHSTYTVSDIYHYGNSARLRSRNGMLAYLYENDSSPHYAALYDTETMTQVQAWDLNSAFGFYSRPQFFF